MRILSVNNSLDAAFRHMGHEVISLSVTTAGIHSLHRLTDVAGFNPHVFIQKEILGAKVCFRDIHSLTCAKGFWSIDTHLNYYWQRYYAQLFDVLFTPHLAYISCLKDTWLHPNMHRLAQPGNECLWVPHTQREHNSCFVGRRSAYRIIRERMCKLLHDKYNMAVFDGMAFNDMLNLYCNTRLLPNECIAFETNFRLLEGASCGCCILSPVIGEDQDVLFTPGKEIIVYRDAAELLSLMDFYHANPQLAEQIGQSAHKRVQAEHLPRNRAKAILQALTNTPKHAAQGEAANTALVMSVGMLCLNDLVSYEDIDTLLSTLPHPLNELRIRLLFAIKKDHSEQVQALLQQAQQALAHAEPSEEAQDLAIAGGGAAFYLNKHDVARDFFILYRGLAQRTESIHADMLTVADMWIADLVEDKKLIMHGLAYSHGCCHTALDMILALSEVDPLSDTWAQHLHSIRSVCHTLPYLDMTAMARLSLNNPDSLEYSMGYMASALKCFDLETAWQERFALLEVAQQRGMEKKIQAMLQKFFPYWQ